MSANIGGVHRAPRQAGGQNIVLESRYAEGQLTRLPALTAELVRLAPAVIWTHSTEAVQAVKQATTTIPIVIGVESNVVEEGLAAGLARPGSNLTGMELRDIELTGKRLQLLKEAVPTTTRVAVLVNPTLSVHARVPDNIATTLLEVGLMRSKPRSDLLYEAPLAILTCLQERTEPCQACGYALEPAAHCR